MVHDGKVLLLKRAIDPYRGYWDIPGGFCDGPELPVDAAVREVFEETGWSIAAPRRIGAFRRFVYMPEYDRWAEKLCTIYLARPVRRLGRPSEPGHEAVWMPLGAACRVLGNAGDRHFARAVASI